jgi:hypothetical protein
VRSILSAKRRPSEKQGELNRRQQRRTWISTVTAMKTSAIGADPPWKIHRVRNQT